MENTSGIYPVEYKVVVLPDQIEDVTPSGIVKMTPHQKDLEHMAQTDGVLVAVSDMAFRKWDGELPKPGDKVKYAKWAGMMVTGSDGKEYRVINDQDLVAILK